MHAFFSKKVKFLDYYSTEGRDFVIKQENNLKIDILKINTIVLTVVFEAINVIE